ncbi:MAG: hypothetical protein VX874_15805 [Pseudomonadota bacterium]|nr:hypothetical protein [Pseudomonadota bacterium]
MTANSAFAAARHEPLDSLDDFPTPPWATRALLRELSSRGLTLMNRVVREPAANRGFMLRPIAEVTKRIIASDIHDYGIGLPVQDYLAGPEPDVDWTITNPPFNLAVDFIERALEQSRVGVAIFQRTAFLEGQERFETLFDRAPPAHVFQFVERVPLHRGILRDPDETYFDERSGTHRKPSTMASYAWFVWRKPRIFDAPSLHWIRPCRKRFTRPGDYAVIGNLGATLGRSS